MKDNLTFLFWIFSFSPIKSVAVNVTLRATLPAVKMANSAMALSFFHDQSFMLFPLLFNNILL